MLKITQSIDLKKASKIAAIQSVPVLRSLSENDLGYLTDLMTVTEYRRLDVIFTRGEKPGFFFVISGAVCLYRVAYPQETIFNVFSKGDHFAESSLFDGTLAEDFGFRAMSQKAKIGFIPRLEFLEFLERNPFVVWRLGIETAKRMEAASAAIQDLSKYSVDSRLASILVKFADSFGSPVTKGIKIGVHLTNTEIACMIGTTRETVNRNLGKFWDRQLINMSEKNIIVTDREGLEAIRRNPSKGNKYESMTKAARNKKAPDLSSASD